MPTRIIKERCNDCCICIFQCGGFVYEYKDKGPGRTVAAVRPANCVDCLICVERCPRQAIKVYFKGEDFPMDFERDIPRASDKIGIEP